MVELASSSGNIRAHWWINPPRRAGIMGAQDRVLAAIKNTLTAPGIDLPFPIQQILWHDQNEATDGDRKSKRESWPAGQGGVPQSRTKAQQEQQAATDDATASPKQAEKTAG